MKLIAQIARIFTGVVFVFSGIIKLNDPVGTQIKLEEYFDVFAQDLPFMAGFWEALVPFALVFSVILCSLEVIAGVCLLLSWNLKRTAWFLLALCIFFAFLTFYSAYFNKVTDCGCFGETIKLKPWTSFWKDIVLLVLILIILWKRNVFAAPNTGKYIIATTIFCLFFGIQAIRHLPWHDGLAYAIGQNIPKNMKPSEPLKFRYTMEKDGKEEEFDQYPTDTTYKFKSMELLNENAKPRITDYRVWNNEGDFTEDSFKGKKLYILVGHLDHASFDHIEDIKALAKSLEGTDIAVAALTSNPESEFQAFRHQYQLAVPFYFVDGKVLKTIIRSNPGIWLMKDGTVVGKWHHNDVPSKEEVIEACN
ncbi:MAG: DoxX family protein [Spirosomataceae bacterium]